MYSIRSHPWCKFLFTDIFFNKLHNILAVPNFNSNTVEFIPVSPSVVETKSNHIFGFELLQNYPNPFNPNTTIRYELTEGSNVILKIYNLLGKEIVELVNEFQPAGLRSINWDGKDKNGYSVCSGMYLYSLISNDFSQTKKMLVIK